MRVPFEISVLAIIASIGVAAGAMAADDADIVAGAVGKKLDRNMQRSTGDLFWGAVVVARDGEVLLAKGYGSADYGARPNTADSLFEIASASKQFTAAGVLRLHMQGKLDVDDSITEFFEDVPDDKRAITVHQLLTHTSGISPNIGLPYASTATRDEFLEAVLSEPLASEPGETFAYCNVGYALLAALIEVVSGQSFESYMEEAVFSPAGLKDTGFIGDATLDASRATTRLSSGPASMKDATAINWHWSWGYRGMGGVVTTVHDLAAWHRALRGDEVLDAAAKEIFYEPVLGSYACGWQVGTSDRGTKFVAHGGRVEGYGCQFVRYLDEDVVIAILSNGKSDVLAVQRAIEDVLFPKPMVTVTIDVTRFELNEYSALQTSSPAWIGRRNGGMLELRLVHGDDGEAMATIDVPEGVAKRLAAELERMLAGRANDGEDEPAMDASIFLAGHGGANRAMTLMGIEPMLMPSYTGVGKDGERIEDERITFIVNDRERHFWPVMTKMNLRASQALLEALRETGQ